MKFENTTKVKKEKKKKSKKVKENVKDKNCIT